MANPSDQFWQSVVDASEGQKNRMAQYATQYNENHAYRLANAYAQFPWVNPQLLVSLVLNDSDDMLPQVAEYAAARMAQTGVTPADIAHQDSIAGGIQENLLRDELRDDPEGNMLLSEYVKSYITAAE